MTDKYNNPKKRPDTMKRESPQDFMKNFINWKKKNPERNVTPKGYAIIRNEQKPK